MYYPEGSDEVKVKEWRYKLQSSFLSEIPLKNEDMPELHELFTEIEKFHMTIQCLQYSKMGNLMRHIGKLDMEKIPRDEEFAFRRRALALVEKWLEITSSMKVNMSTGNRAENELISSPDPLNNESNPNTSATRISVVKGGPPQRSSRSKKSTLYSRMSAKQSPDALLVRDWRLKIQKTFLSKYTLTDEDMPGADKLFQDIEAFFMTIECLEYSKIEKGMRHVSQLLEDKIPRDEEFKFRERASNLVAKWQALVHASFLESLETHESVPSSVPGEPTVSLPSILPDGGDGLLPESHQAGMNQANFSARHIAQPVDTEGILAISSTTLNVVESEMVPGIAQLSISKE